MDSSPGDGQDKMVKKSMLQIQIAIRDTTSDVQWTVDTIRPDNSTPGGVPSNVLGSSPGQFGQQQLESVFLGSLSSMSYKQKKST